MRFFLPPWDGHCQYLIYLRVGLFDMRVGHFFSPPTTSQSHHSTNVALLPFLNTPTLHKQCFLSELTDSVTFICGIWRELPWHSGVSHVQSSHKYCHGHQHYVYGTVRGPLLVCKPCHATAVVTNKASLIRASPSAVPCGLVIALPHSLPSNMYIESNYSI